MAVARRRRSRSRSPFAIGLITLAIILVGTFLGFTKHIPFTHGFRVKAVFESANSLRANSPVRIAGVEVGKVKKIEPKEGTDQSVVTMEINDNGLPIHEDATAKIRPRIFLEGNFFIDLQPGTPSSPKLADSDVIKVTRTATPVQLDEVLTSLQSDTRQDLRDVLDGLAKGLNSKPSRADNRNADPSARGQTGAESLNDAYKSSAPALRGGSQVNVALLGTQPDRDLSRLLDGTARTTGALIRNESQLKDLISNFNTTMGALASQSGNLRTSIRLLAPTLENANAAFASLNRAFPPTRAFARDILPGVRETPSTINASFPWIAQAQGLFSKPELRGLAQDLAPATADLARLTNESLTLLPKIDRTALCARDVILPTGNIVIHDPFDTGTENYKEFWWTMVGLSGESQNFDGNGSYVRFQPGGGSQAVALGSAKSPTGQLIGSAAAPVQGVQPKYPGKRPPYVTSVPCYKSKIPNLNGSWAAKGPGENAP
jgi:phospholipid/cholesterol/gamma-HCH transport system substrate-binding protein